MIRRKWSLSSLIGPFCLQSGRLILSADIGYESLINLMLKDLFKLLVACVSEPAETISRVGCSCIRSALRPSFSTGFQKIFHCKII